MRVEPVVKADAYGHGALPIALALEAAGADGVGVSTFDEAMELRDGGSRLPILVLYPVPVELIPDAIAHRIAVIVGDPALADRLLAAVAARTPGTRGALERRRGPRFTHIPTRPDAERTGYDRDKGHTT